MVLEELDRLNKQYINYKKDASINKSVLKFQEYLDQQKATQISDERARVEQPTEAKAKLKKPAKKSVKSEMIRMTRRMTRSQAKKKQLENLEIPEPAQEESKEEVQKPTKPKKTEEIPKIVVSSPIKNVVFQNLKMTI